MSAPVSFLFGRNAHHVARLNDVDSNVGVSPLDSQGATEMTNSGLGSVVGSLGLRDIDNSTTHAANEDDATGSLALHEVTGDSSGEEVSAVDVDSPELSDAVDGVLDGVKVLCEAGRGDKVVNLSVGANHIRKNGFDRMLVAHYALLAAVFGLYVSSASPSQ